MLSGVPQGTVLGPLLFLIMISDIDKDVSASKLVSFAADTRLYSGVNIIGPSTLVLDLGVSMSSNCMFDFHISNLYKRCSNLAVWILRTFTMRDPQVMPTLYKSLVMSRLDYASQLWSPYLLKHVYLIEKVQRPFTKHISGMCYLSYNKGLEVLKLYSLQRRRETYGIIYVWKIVEGLVPNLSDHITCSFSDRRRRTCIVCHSGAGRLGTLKYNSFRWRSIRMFNRLPKAISMLSSCSVVDFKSQLDSYLRNIVDLPCRPGFNNSLNGGDCLHSGHYADDLAAN